MKYYIDLLGGDEKSYRLRLDSPFKKENLKTFISPLNPGNHIVFLPSFEYLKK